MVDIAYLNFLKKKLKAAEKETRFLTHSKTFWKFSVEDCD